MVSVPHWLQHNHDKKPLLRNSLLRGLRPQYQILLLFCCYVHNAKQEWWKQQQQKLTLALRAIWLRSLRFDQDKKYIFSIQRYGLTWFKPIKLKARYSSNQYVDFTTTLTTPWSRVKICYLFHHETVALEITYITSSYHVQYPYHELTLYYNYFLSQEFQWSLTWFTSLIFNPLQHLFRQSCLLISL